MCCDTCPAKRVPGAEPIATSRPVPPPTRVIAAPPLSARRRDGPELSARKIATLRPRCERSGSSTGSTPTRCPRMGVARVCAFLLRRDHRRRPQPATDTPLHGRFWTRCRERARCRAEGRCCSRCACRPTCSRRSPRPSAQTSCTARARNHCCLRRFGRRSRRATARTTPKRVPTHGSAYQETAAREVST